MTRAVLIAGAILALAPVSPAAAHSILRFSGPELTYVAEDATSANRLTVRLSGGELELRDPTSDGGIDPGSCRPGDVSADANAWIIQAFCPRAGVERVRLDLGEREDAVTASAAIPFSALGGTGADVITTGAAADEVTGDEGNDRLAAGAGDDRLDGGLGLDELDGGPGADVLAVRDGEADRAACGDGHDRVEADTLDHVAPDCEDVAVTPTPPPPGATTAGDRTPPRVDAGADTLQRVGRRRVVRIAATTSERGTLAASGFLDVAGISLPLGSDRRRVTVAGGGAVLTIRLGARHMRLCRRAFARGRRPVARLRVVATDAAGNSAARRAPRIRLAR